MLNLALVRSFVGLVETGSFQAAAARLNIAQPTLSQHLKKLEDDLGVRLIERSHAGSRPTRQGARFLPHARHLLSSAARAEAVASEAALIVGCSGNIAGYFMSKAFKGFLDEDRWHGKWEIKSAPNPQIADMLLNHEIDLAAMEWPLAHPDVLTEPWRTAEMTVILAPDHPLAGRCEISVEEFLELEMIGGESGSGTGTLLRETLGDLVDRLRICANVGSTEAVKRAVMSGLGASVVLSDAVAQEVAHGGLAAVAVTGKPMRKSFFTSRLKSAAPEDISTRLARFLSA